MNFIKKQWYLLTIVLLVIVKNWFLEVIPFVTRSVFIHDDGLFLRQASSIVAGNWLGDFNQYNLIKGPLYPIWVAANYYTGISIIHSQDLLYLTACLVIIRAIQTDIKNKFALLAIFSALYLNPVSFDFLSVSHGFRMVIYTSFSLLVFGSLLGLLLRVWQSGRRFYYWSLLFGVALSLFWYIREEGVWVLPGIVLITITIAIISTYTKNWIALKRTLVGFILIPVLLWGAATSILSYINWRNYAAPYVVEVMTPNFTRAYNALLSIESQEFRRYFPVRQETMERVMALSPKAAELTGFNTGKEFPAAHFIWSFRHAVSLAGYYDKGAKAVDQYYSDLADELEELCENGTLKCLDLFLSDCPPWRPVYSKEFIGVLTKQIKEVVRFKDFSMDQTDHYSQGDSNFIETIKRLTHARIQFQRNEISTGTEVFFYKNDQEKNKFLEKLGNTQLIVRPFLFYSAFLGMVFLILRNVVSRQYNPYTLFSLCVAGSIFTLCVGLTIIELTSYDSLFRARHGMYPLPPLFIISVIIAFVYNREHYGQQKQ